jgi:hypothetical protein
LGKYPDDEIRDVKKITCKIAAKADWYDPTIVV